MKVKESHPKIIKNLRSYQILDRYWKVKQSIESGHYQKVQLK